MEAGDPAFWKMLLDRVWPAPKSVETLGTRGHGFFAPLGEARGGGGGVAEERGGRRPTFPAEWCVSGSLLLGPAEPQPALATRNQSSSLIVPDKRRTV